MPEWLPKITEQMRLVLMAAMAVVILAVVNMQIIGKETIISQGETVLLQLAPKDPRSLLQGDYMALRYSMANEVAGTASTAEITDGRIIIELAQNGQASFLGLYQGQQLTDSQQILTFRKRGESVRLASDAFFFEEGQWATYSSARFGELRVDDDGNAVLIGLRDSDKQPLGQSLH